MWNGQRGDREESSEGSPEWETVRSLAPRLHSRPSFRISVYELKEELDDKEGKEDKEANEDSSAWLDAGSSKIAAEQEKNAEEKRFK